MLSGWCLPQAPLQRALCLLLVLLTVTSTGVLGAKEAPANKADVIEEVNAKQLENLVAESDYVAVFWCKCLL